MFELEKEEQCGGNIVGNRSVNREKRLEGTGTQTPVPHIPE